MLQYLPFLLFASQVTHTPFTYLDSMGTRFKSDTKDPAVNVTTWVLLVTIVFSVLARLVTKIRIFKRLTTDDLLIIASLILGIGQSIVVSLAVGSGYGKHSKDVSSAEMEQVMKVHIF